MYRIMVSGTRLKSRHHATCRTLCFAPYVEIFFLKYRYVYLKHRRTTVPRAMPHFPAESTKLPIRPDIDAKSALARRPSASTPQRNRIRIQNRRKRYLELHPEYFQDSTLELSGLFSFHTMTRKSGDLFLADPLLYDRLIRRFKTADERETEGKARGSSGFAAVLEANLVRSEARLHALTHPGPDDPLTYSWSTKGESLGVELDDDDDDRVQSRAEGWERWVEAVSRRFVSGADADFGDYAAVDGDETLDYWEEKEELERWVDEGYEEFVGQGNPSSQTGRQDF